MAAQTFIHVRQDAHALLKSMAPEPRWRVE